MKRRARAVALWASCWLLALAALPSVGSPAPQPSASAANSVASPRSAVVDPVTLRPFVEGVMAQQFARGPLAGAVVVVVQNGELVLAQGFGHADIARGVPVDPARTQFRIGSISKVFVYLAALQQVAAGKLQLDAPIAPLVPALPVDADAASLGGPLTLRHLLTHTAGFDEQVVGLFSQDPQRVRPLAELLARELPRRIRVAGRDPSYSNHGAALVAHLVERVSGESYPLYLRRNLIDRLGLAHTTIEQPPVARGSVVPAFGYRLRDGALQAMPAEIVPMAAIGGMTSTGTDMALLMLELLAPTDRLAPRAQLLRLRERLHTVDPRLSAMLFGLYESSREPLSFGHGGDTIDFHSDLRLYPQHRLGVFVAYNSEYGGAAKAEFTRAFEAHYFPHRLVQSKARAIPEDERAIAGWYAPLRNSEHSLARAALLFSAMPIHFDAEGRLVVPGPERARLYERIDRDVYREPVSGELLVVRRDEEGLPYRLHSGSFAALTVGRVAVVDAPVFNQLWFAGGLLGLLGWLIATPWWWRAAKRRTQSRGESWPRQRRMYLLGLLAGVALLVGASGVLVLMGDPTSIAFGQLTGVRVMLTSIVVGAALLAITVLLLLWQRRAHGSLLFGILVAGLLLAWLANWNLVGFHYPDLG